MPCDNDRMLWLPSAGRKILMVEHQEPGQPFETGVGLPLLLKHRHGPVELLRVDRFVVPIGAFDQPHPNRRAATLRPAGQGLQITLCILQVGLDHDAHVRPIAKLVLHQDLLEDGQRQILGLV